jgi:hypothetical protein
MLSMHFAYSFSDGMLELHWGKQVHLCHKHTLATADAMCRMKWKYLSHVVNANPLTSSPLNLSDFSYGEASKRKLMLWKYQIPMTLSFILVLAADIRSQSGQLVCVRETSECYCETCELECLTLSSFCEEMYHNTVHVPLCEQTSMLNWKEVIIS